MIIKYQNNVRNIFCLCLRPREAKSCSRADTYHLRWCGRAQTAHHQTSSFSSHSFLSQSYCFQAHFCQRTPVHFADDPVARYW